MLGPPPPCLSHLYGTKSKQPPLQCLLFGPPLLPPICVTSFMNCPSRSCNRHSRFKVLRGSSPRMRIPSLAARLMVMMMMMTVKRLEELVPGMSLCVVLNIGFANINVTSGENVTAVVRCKPLNQGLISQNPTKYESTEL